MTIATARRVFITGDDRSVRTTSVISTAMDQAKWSDPARQIRG